MGQRPSTALETTTQSRCQCRLSPRERTSFFGAKRTALSAGFARKQNGRATDSGSSVLDRRVLPVPGLSCSKGNDLDLIHHFPHSYHALTHAQPHVLVVQPP